MSNPVFRAVSERISPARNDFVSFQRAVSESFVPLHVTTTHPEAFRGVVRGATVDDVSLCEVHATAHTVERTPALIARSERAHMKLSLMLSGSALLVQDGREAVLRPGDVAVYDTQRPYTLMFDEQFRTLVVMFPKRLIDVPTELMSQLNAVRMDGTHGVVPLVSAYLGQLATAMPELHGATGVRLMHTTLDLVTTMFADELDVEAAALDPRQTLMREIRAHIEQHLAQPELCPDSIAAAHFISTRHLHGLFKAQGSTVSTWIRERRLEQCRRELMDPLHLDRPVGVVAARWGFTDAAHFSRAFKTQYGVAPSEARAARTGS